MKSMPTKALAIAIAAGIAFPMSALATNGYFLIGFGAKSRSMGGVGVAYAQDSLAIASNPAGMADIDMNTMRIDVGGDLFSPPRAVVHESATLPANAQSGMNVFLIPNMGGAYKFNRNLTMGMAAVGAGLGTRYDQTVRNASGVDVCNDGDPATNGNNFFNFNCNASNTVGVMLMQMQMLPSVAYKINKQNALGASLAIAVQSFRAYGLQAFDTLGFSATNGDLTNKGNAWSYGGGIRLGGLHKFFDERLNFGWNYSSRVFMTKFDKYRNLFAEHGGFDIPENYAIGVAYKYTKKLTVAADVQRINFSDVKSVGNPGPNPADPNHFFPPGFDVLGKSNGLGFGWKDQIVYKLGFNYDYDDTWSFRSGVNYGKSPIPKNQVLFNMLAPATPEWHLTLGGSYRPSPNVEWSFSYIHAFENVIKGPTAFGPTGQPVVGENAAISMKQNALGMSFAYKM